MPNFWFSVETFQFQEMLFSNRSDASGFYLQSQYYYVSWGKADNNSELSIASYTQREDRGPRYDRRKEIYMPQRVQSGRVRTHGIHSKEGYHT